MLVLPLMGRRRLRRARAEVGDRLVAAVRELESRDHQGAEDCDRPERKEDASPLEPPVPLVHDCAPAGDHRLTRLLVVDAVARVVLVDVELPVEPEPVGIGA